MKTHDEIVLDTLRSLLDVTEELANTRQLPEEQWGQVVSESFAELRRELAESFELGA